MKPRRRATTLFELILVLAILVIVASLSVPSLGSMYGYYKINGAVDSVRSAWADARAHAIEEGRPYRFSVQPDGRAFRVAPDQDDYWPGQGSADDPQGHGAVIEHSLPTGVRFAVGDAGGGQAPAAEPERYDLEEEPVKGGSWSTTVVFLPDGTAREDVRIRFDVKGTRPMTLQLRGLTGDVSVETEPR
jgi:hypothetical protein